MKSPRRRSRSHRSGLGRRENAGILAPGGRRKPSARRTRTESTGKGFFVVSGGRDRSSASWCGRKRPEPQSEASPTSLMTASGGGRMNRCLARNEGSKKNLRSKTGVTLAQARITESIRSKAFGVVLAMPLTGHRGGGPGQEGQRGLRARESGYGDASCPSATGRDGRCLSATANARVGKSRVQRLFQPRKARRVGPSMVGTHDESNVVLTRGRSKRSDEVGDGE